MTDEKNNNPRSQSSMNSFPEPKQFREQAEQLVKDAPLPDLDFMAPEETQQRFHELRVKQIEAELQNEQLRTRLEERDDQAELFRIVTENMLDMIALTDMEGNFIFAGKSHEILGYEPGFLIGKNVMDFVHPEDLPRIKEEFGESFASGQPRRAEYRYRCKDGSYLWLETVGNFYKDKDGIPQKIVFSSRDITERKQAEEALQRKEHDLRESQRIAHVGSWRLDVATNQVVWTEELYNMYGLDPSLPPPPYTEHMKLFTPESWERLSTALAHTRETGIPYTLELETIRKDGSNGWMWVQGEAEVDSAGKVVELWGAAQDIAERKQAEDALRKSEEKFRHLFERAEEGILIARGETIEFANPALARMLGYSIDKITSKPFVTFLHPDDLETVRDLHLRMMQEEFLERRYDFRIVTSDGRVKWVSIHAQFIEWDGAPANLSFITDITERKQAEDALRRSENYYRAIFETSATAMFIIEENTIISNVNSNFEKLSGYSKQEVEGKKSWIEFIHPDDVEWMKENHSLRRNDPLAAPVEYEFRFFTRNDKLRHGFLTVDMIPDTTKSVVSLIDITERKRTMEALRENENQISSIFRSAPVGIGSVVNRVLSKVNDRLCEMTGYDESGLLGQSARMLYPSYKDFEFVGREKYAQITDHGTGTVETRWQKKEGTIIDVLLSSTPVDVEDQSKAVTFTALDITGRKQAEAEREKLQAQLAQAQKMESVGRLAGGVAHDFNNKLSIINGYAELAMEAIDSSDPLQETIQEIYTAGQQSASIVRQLLAFARKQTISPVLLDLNDIISSMLKMLQRLIGEHIDLAWHPGKNLWPVKIDPSQVDQIMANLAVNSRDAISDVGKLTIETKNTTIDEDYCKTNPEAIPGRYVMLAVSDDGCGMEKEVKDQLFEPFFTTKEIGQGTGLGLPTIYGIVKQNNGFIHVYSEPGEGASFKLYFPSHEETKPSLHSATESTGETPKGTETILVVEDEKTILQMSKQMLKRLGYSVETAESAAEALQIAKQYGGTIHLLITDVIMPEMSGRDLSSRLSQNHPGVRTLYMSGYTADVIAHHGVLDEGFQFIQKPFSLRDLALKVREAIGQE